MFDKLKEKSLFSSRSLASNENNNQNIDEFIDSDKVIESSPEYLSSEKKVLV